VAALASVPSSSTVTFAWWTTSRNASSEPVPSTIPEKSAPPSNGSAQSP
jgi:hypothetical protein